MSTFKLYKPHTIALAEKRILKAVENNTQLTTTEISQASELLNDFHGVRTLQVDQVARICKRLVSQNKLAHRYAGQGMYVASDYSIPPYSTKSSATA
jgi:hypothetical protein